MNQVSLCEAAVEADRPHYFPWTKSLRSSEYPKGVARLVRCFTAAPFLLPIVVGCGTESLSDAEMEQVASNEQAIIDGNEDWLDSAVAVQTTQCLGAPWHCGGVLISPTAVLTAAHCVDWAPDDRHPTGVDWNLRDTFKVAVDCHDVTSPSCSWLEVDRIFSHPDNNRDARSYLNDIAIIRLKAPVAGGTVLRLMNQARMSEVGVSNLVKVYGWGPTTEGGGNSPVLRSAEIPLDHFITNGFILEWLPDGRVHTVPGDSGGPATVRRDNEQFVVGLNSALADSSCLETSAAGYTQWIADRVPDLPVQSVLPSAQIGALQGALR